MSIGPENIFLLMRGRGLKLTQPDRKIMVVDIYSYYVLCLLLLAGLAHRRLLISSFSEIGRGEKE